MRVPNSISRTPPLRRAGDRDEGSAARLAAAGLAIPGVAVARDEGNVGERLDVLDERRPSVNAALERPWRHHRGSCVTSVDVVRPQPTPRRRHTRAARQRCGRNGHLRALAERSLERASALRRDARPDVQHDLSRAEVVAASSAPSSTRCGRAAISARSLALSGSPSAPLTRTRASSTGALRDGRPLSANGKARATAAEQAGDGQHRNQARAVARGSGPRRVRGRAEWLRTGRSGRPGRAVGAGSSAFAVGVRSVRGARPRRRPATARGCSARQ